MPAPLRDVPPECVELVKSFEGIPDGDPSTVLIDAYLCPAGVWTIGWGHAIRDGRGQMLRGPAQKAAARAAYPGGITREQAETLLRADLLDFTRDVSRLLKVPVNDHQFAALLSFAFNLGAGNLQASTLLRMVNAGDFAGAAEQFMRWNKSTVNGVKKELPGLTRRRKAERALFLGLPWQERVTRGRRAALPEVLPRAESPDAPTGRRRSAKGEGSATEPAASRTARKAAPNGSTTARKQKPLTKLTAAKRASRKTRSRPAGG